MQAVSWLLCGLVVVSSGWLTDISCVVYQYYERHFVIVDTQGRAEDWPKKLEFSDHIVSSYAKVLQ